MSPATCSSRSIVLILILELALFFIGAMDLSALATRV